MIRRRLSILILAILLASMGTQAAFIQPARASTIITIEANGSINPSSAPIMTSDNVTYQLTANLSGSIVIRKSGITFDGRGFAIYGSEDEWGFILNSTSNVAIENTYIIGHTYGIYAQYSYNITLAENNIISNFHGVTFVGSTNSLIAANTISGSATGIRFFSSSENLIFHNNFENNGLQQNLTASSNTWSLGYPGGGNYWSDYDGTDQFSGLYQNITGSDGIGDTPYNFTGSSDRDEYPLMGPFGGSTTIGENVTSFPADYVALIFEHVTGEGVTTASQNDTGPTPPPGQFIVKYFNIETTAEYSGIIRIRIAYDDHGMTPEQEGSLKLLQYNPMIGDLDLNGAIDILDLTAMGSKYGLRQGELHWNPKADIAAPYGIIDIFDLVTCAYHYGERGNPIVLWSDIATSTDTANNLIYGETSHLSIFGVTRTS